MTWEELVNKAKELGYTRYGKTHIEKNDLIFFCDGDVIFAKETNGIGVRADISKNRTPSQMYQIMLALED